MRLAVVVLCALAVVALARYQGPLPESGKYIVAEPFNDLERWTVQTSDPEDSTKVVTTVVHQPAVAFSGIENDFGLYIPLAARHYAASLPLAKPYEMKGQGLVFQYELRLENGLECGGAYFKLLQHPHYTARSFNNKSPYTIMFGPDKCGGTNKVHFIFRHQNPKTGEFEEKHLVDAPAIKTDKITHLYTLVVREDNTFSILIDNEVAREGSLLEDFLPSVNPPKEIDDPTDIKPADWVDDEYIPDPEAVKPADWDEDAPEMIVDEDAVMPDGWLEDEPERVPDPKAVKPADWDDELDGDWEAPIVYNPKCEAAPGCGPWSKPVIYNPRYMGKWSAPVIKNPAYIGEWKPRQIPNPDYWEDPHPAHMSAIGGIGLEIWTMNSGLLFDNVFLGPASSLETAREWALKTWQVKYTAEREWARKEGEDLDDADDDSLLSQISEIGAALTEYVEANPIVAVLGVVAVLVPVLTCVVLGTRMGHQAATKDKSEKSKEKSEKSDKSDKASDAAAAASPKGGKKPKKD